MSNPTLDPYTANAEHNVSPQQKITDLKNIISTVKTGILTTRSNDGHLHSRAMTPIKPDDVNQLHLVFLGNNASKKFEEIHNDAHVNVSFYDEKTTNWASIAGVAKVSQNKEFIHKHYSMAMRGYFGDLGDGVHKGDGNDPRISIIEVVPDEIKYWVVTEGYISRNVNTAISAVTGKGHAPGEIRTISKTEIQLTESLQGQ